MLNKLTSITTILSVALLGLFIATPVLAQRDMGMGKGQMQGYMLPFDTNTIETVTGKVTDVVYVKRNTRANILGVHLTVKTEKETIPVHLGPAWYVENQEQFKKGDQVTVTGSRITFNDKPALVASEVVRGDMALRLRDQNGFPAWRGWRRKGMMN